MRRIKVLKKVTVLSVARCGNLEDISNKIGNGMPWCRATLRLTDANYIYLWCQLIHCRGFRQLENWLMDWSIDRCFTPYRQYLRHILIMQQLDRFCIGQICTFRAVMKMHALKHARAWDHVKYSIPRKSNSTTAILPPPPPPTNDS